MFAMVLSMTLKTAVKVYVAETVLKYCMKLLATTKDQTVCNRSLPSIVVHGVADLNLY